MQGMANISKSAFTARYISISFLYLVNDRFNAMLSVTYLNKTQQHNLSMLPGLINLVHWALVCIDLFHLICLVTANSFDWGLCSCEKILIVMDTAVFNFELKLMSLHRIGSPAAKRIEHQWAIMVISNNYQTWNNWISRVNNVYVIRRTRFYGL